MLFTSFFHGYVYLQRVLNKRTQKFIVATRTHSDIYDFKFIYINVKPNIYSVQILKNTECIDRTERGTICASKTPFLKIRRQTYRRKPTKEIPMPEKLSRRNKRKPLSNCQCYKPRKFFENIS